MSREIAEWLALGTAHPVDPANVGRGTAPHRWEFADAGYALAGLPVCMEQLLRVKYMGEPGYSLRAEVVGHALSIVTRWGRIDSEFRVAEIRRAAEAALECFCDPSVCVVCNAQDCPFCGGKEDGPCEMCCPACRGTGVTPYAERKLAAIGKMPGPYRDIERMFDEVTALLSRWEGRGLRMVKRRIRKEAGAKSRQGQEGKK